MNLRLDRRREGDRIGGVRRWRAWLGGAALALSAQACAPDIESPEESFLRFSGSADEAGRAGGAVSEDADSQSFPVPPPPFSSPEIFPCSGCHGDLEPNANRRLLTEEHEDIVLRHDEQHRWCLDCHNAQDRDFLRLADGRLVKFEESYRLCGQCHGPKLADWKAGIHGKRTGEWNGERRYLLCAHCHDPHAPRFKPIAPEPAPVPPQGLGWPE